MGMLSIGERLRKFCYRVNTMIYVLRGELIFMRKTQSEGNSGKKENHGQRYKGIDFNESLGNCVFLPKV